MTTTMAIDPSVTQITWRLKWYQLEPYS